MRIIKPYPARFWAFQLLLLGLLVAPWGRAAETNDAAHYSVRIWQKDDGLPQNSVFSIAQTSDGYLWVGTQEGVVRFDGLKFNPLNESAPAELRHGSIRGICAAEDGSVWLACDGVGLFHFSDGKFQKLTEADGLPSNLLRCLFEARDHSLWIGTEAGLARWKAGKITCFTERNGLGDNSIRGVFQDRNEVLLVATKRGLSSFSDQGVISTLNFGLRSVGNALKGVCQDHDGNLWVASNDGLNRVSSAGVVSFSVADGLPDRITTSVLEDQAHRVWVGTYSGLACMDNGKVVARPLGDAAFGDLIYTIYEDREGNIWTGARDGLYRVNRARVTTYTTRQGLNCNNVMSVCQDREGAIWLGTWGGGINILQGDRVLAYGTTNGLTHDSVLSLEESKDGSFWVGMDFDGGLNRVNAERKNFLARPPGLINSPVLAIHEDHEGSVWVGTRAGLNQFSKGNARAWTTGNGLAGNLVMVIHEDKVGACWFGTDGGLNRWWEHKLSTVSVPDLKRVGVDAIHEDADGALWLGTKGSGLIYYKDGVTCRFSGREGLFSDEIYEILEDDYGYLWMSCRKGIFRVDKKELEQVRKGKRGQVTSSVFGVADGLVSVQCNGVAKPAGWKARDGNLWFPTIRGVVAIDSRIQANDKIPQLAITECVSGNETHPIEIETPGPGSKSGAALALAPKYRPLKIKPGRGDLRISFTALSLQAPERNRFKYRLEEVDPEWRDAENRHEAVYNNLGPGKFRFRLIGCNNDGVWNSTGVELGVILLPHFWQTWMFKVSLPLLAAGVLVLVFRVRIARLRGLERLRIQIAADLHDDVGARLTKVAMVNELLDRNTPEGAPTKSQVQSIANTTREIIQAMDEIVWTINPRNDTLDNLANYIFQYTQEYFQSTGVRCRLDLPMHLPHLAISTEQRHNLFMAFKEALNNILKHSRATEARVGLTLENGKLKIMISDNGSGFELAAAETAGGDGLINMKKRLKQIGGKMTVETSAGGGTQIEMETALR